MDCDGTNTCACIDCTIKRLTDRGYDIQKSREYLERKPKDNVIDFIKWKKDKGLL